MNRLLLCTIGSVRAWTRVYTLRMDTSDRDRRRAEIESDLWEYHEDLRRRGASPSGIAFCMLARLVLGLPHDLLWRLECEEDRDMAPRQSAWTTGAALGAAVGITVLWALFIVSSLVALPPLPGAADVERVYARPVHAWPPLPPAPSRIAWAARRMPPPPPPPPPPRPPR